jgi:hypothetical protein
VPDKPILQLDTTGQYLSQPLVGAHDNETPVTPALEHCLAQLAKVSGN